MRVFENLLECHSRRYKRFGKLNEFIFTFDIDLYIFGDSRKGAAILIQFLIFIDPQLVDGSIQLN